MFSAMVKTTIILDDEIYKRLVNEALEKYGSTRKLSLLVNEKLAMAGAPPRVKRQTVRLAVELDEGKIQKMTEEGWEEAARWKR